MTHSGKHALEEKHEPTPKRAKKAVLDRQWTHFNPITGEVQERLIRKDIDYRRNYRQGKKKRPSNVNKETKDTPKEKHKDNKNTEQKPAEKDKDDTNFGFHELCHRFEGHVCVITGGGRGVGQACALRLAQEGGIIYILDKMRFKETENLIHEKCGKNASVTGIKCDVTDAVQVAKCIKEIIAKNEYIDVLVQCASFHGVDRGKYTEEISETDFDKVIAVNLKAQFLVCKEVIPLMNKENYGRIVNFSSLWGKEGQIGHLAYAASKAGVIAMTKTMALEYAGSGITINCIAPAFADATAEAKTLSIKEKKEYEDDHPMNRMGELEEIAGVVAFIASEENTYTTGFCYDVSGGLASY